MNKKINLTKTSTKKYKIQNLNPEDIDKQNTKYHFIFEDDDNKKENKNK